MSLTPRRPDVAARLSSRGKFRRFLSRSSAAVTRGFTVRRARDTRFEYVHITRGPRGDLGARDCILRRRGPVGVLRNTDVGTALGRR